jgi:hypothetical protein
MPEQFAKVETRLLGHPKFLGLGMAARGLWLSGLLYAKAQGSGGFVPESWAEFGSGCGERVEQACIAELVSRGLWERTEGGWQMHDYAEHQSTPDFAALGRRSAEVRQEKYGTTQPRTATNDVHRTARTTFTERPKETETETENPPIVPPSRSASLAQPAARPGPVVQVFEAWKTAAGKNGQTVLDPKRRRAIVAALKAYPIADLLDAVQATIEVDGKRYDELTLLLRDAPHIERCRDQVRVSRTPAHETPTWVPPVVANPPRPDEVRAGGELVGEVLRRHFQPATAQGA